MDLMAKNGKQWRLFNQLLPGLCIALLVVLTGCPGVTPDPGTDPPTGTDVPEDVTTELITPISTIHLSVNEEPISILYTVTGNPDLTDPSNSIIGFRIQVADESPNSVAIGEEVVIATNLPAGENQQFTFNPQQSGIGAFRFGIIATIDGIVTRKESAAVIVVEGSPDPKFVFPTKAKTTIDQSESIVVKFDAQDPENEVHWRLFFLTSNDDRNDPADEIGKQLSTGVGNSGEFIFDGANFSTGEYELGFSATDSGFSIASTVARGLDNRIVTKLGPKIIVVEIGTPKFPTLTFLAPTDAQEIVLGNAGFKIRFSASTDEEGAVPKLKIFYDTDRIVSNGVTPVDNDVPSDDEELLLNTSGLSGEIFIGGTIEDGINSPVTEYADGSLLVITNVSLAITAPNSPVTVKPGEEVRVAWVTDAPATVGTVTVIATPVDVDGNAINGRNPETIHSSATSNTTSTFFSQDKPGLYKISVTIFLSAAIQETVTSPNFFRVSALPKIFWLSQITDTSSGLDGAIFRGVNFEDNAGSSFSTAGDLNNDGFDDFVIVSRYGKPRSVSQNGIGPGEAYILYGGTGSKKLTGDNDLNSTGNPSDPARLTGVTINGIPTVSGSNDTFGLGAVHHIPDVDGDGKGELIFGFPHIDSTCKKDVFCGGSNCEKDPLCREGQFLGGGVVILSSNNDVLATPSEFFSPVIDLMEVGRRFRATVDEVIIEPQNLRPEFTVEEVLEDRREFDETSQECGDGSDDFFDTVIGPNRGFTPLLALPVSEFLHDTLPEFTIYDDTVSPAPGVCPPTLIDFDTTIAECPGSGFYPAAAIALQPRGTRIIGIEDKDGFGTSITTSTVSKDFGLVDVIISAPNRSHNAGIGFIMNNDNYWRNDLPAPYQSIIGLDSFCELSRSGPTGADRIVGDLSDKIQIVEGIDDFNGDGRDDIAIGAWNRNKVYIAYRRAPRSEGDFLLNKIALDPGNQQRLDGMLIRSSGKFGWSITSGIDFNGDGQNDLIIGSPEINGGDGEVIIVYGNNDVVTPASGISVSELLALRDSAGNPVAFRIRGNPRGNAGAFGYNVANAGDINGDGIDDLLIAAPDASPFFDPNPSDSVEELISQGIDLDQDGVADNVPGGASLSSAGIVYILYGSNRLDNISTCSSSGHVCIDDEDCPAGEFCDTNSTTVNIDQLGQKNLDGFMIVGRRTGDHLGGGDAGNAAQGGNISKSSHSARSFGLARAGDVDNDGRSDFLIGAILADPRSDQTSQNGKNNGGEAYLIYGSSAP